jgi:hypothetical protein
VETGAEAGMNIAGNNGKRTRSTGKKSSGGSEELRKRPPLPPTVFYFAEFSAIYSKTLQSRRQ